MPLRETATEAGFETVLLVEGSVGEDDIVPSLLFLESKFYQRDANFSTSWRMRGHIVLSMCMCAAFTGCWHNYITY